MIEKDFLEMMQDTVVFNASASVNAYGKQSFSSASSTYNARLIFQERITRDDKGREVVEAGRAILYGYDLSLTTLHKMTLPDGSTPKILSVATIKDTEGDHHTVVSFGQ